MDPASTPIYAAHGLNNLYHSIVISGKAYISPTQANSTLSAGGFCLWEPQLCYSEGEKEETGVQYHPGYLIFYPTAVVIIPFSRTFSFERTEESKGTGVFHPLSSVPLGDGLHQSQYSHPSFPGAQKITGALYLTEAATYTIGRHFCPLASPSWENQSVGGLEGESGEQNWPSLETTGVLGGKQGEQKWRSSTSKPVGALEDDSGIQNSSSSFLEITYANVCARSLPSSTSGKPASSKSWKTQKARDVAGKKDQQDQPSQDNLLYKSLLGSEPIIEGLGGPVTSSLRTKDSKWSSGQDMYMLTVDGTYQITPSVLSANKGDSQVHEEIELLLANKRRSQIVEEIEELLTEEGKSDLADEEIEGKHTGASVELEDQEYGGTKVCHLQCQIERALCAHLCPLPSHPGDCPPCKAPVKQDCHCKVLVHSFSCDQFTSASETERERMCSCGGFCHKRLPNCAHMCSDICHARPCQPSNCHKKVMLRCKCQRLRKAWLCCDVQEAKLWGKSSPKQKPYQLGKYIGLIPCDEECLLSVERKETQNKTGVQRTAEEAEVDEAGLAIPRRRWSFTSKVVIALLAILSILGMLFVLVN